MINQDILRIKSKPEKQQGIFFAALSGFIAGTVVTVVSSFINTWLFPDLPLYLNWRSIFLGWILWSVWGGILAGITWLSSEGWKSIFLSALCISLTILTINSIQSSQSMMMSLVILIGLLLPFTAMASPLALLFFWLASRFVQAMSLKGWPRQKIFLVNFIIILALGSLSGLFVKMNAKAVQAVQIIHGILQDAPVTLDRSLMKTEGFDNHMGQPYTLSQVPSSYSTVGVDVTAHYADGYTLVCTVVLYPGSDPYINPCKGAAP